ncbi:MAG: hypothetical protein ACI9WU_004406 [Myxococcota bacterium]
MGDQPGNCAEPPPVCCTTHSDCVGAEVFACLPEVEAVMGSCIPNPEVCCATDIDCGPGGDCVGQGASGVCYLPAPTDTGCWEDSDCGSGLFCQGEVVCPCGALCDAQDQPGFCAPDQCLGQEPLPAGCADKAGCAPGLFCVLDGGCNPSTCVCSPETGDSECTADCQPGTCLAAP